MSTSAKPIHNSHSIPFLGRQSRGVTGLYHQKQARMIFAMEITATKPVHDGVCIYLLRSFIEKPVFDAVVRQIASRINKRSLQGVDVPTLSHDPPGNQRNIVMALGLIGRYKDFMANNKRAKSYQFC